MCKGASHEVPLYHGLSRQPRQEEQPGIREPDGRHEEGEQSMTHMPNSPDHIGWGRGAPLLTHH